MTKVLEVPGVIKFYMVYSSSIFPRVVRKIKGS